ncbi:YolD-like family protein [Tepidibacillus fermentans]|uniref:YolD-like protein n=1 Tax=Tepidibacillus fermentans TaxID=1281767 RepID=A0A4R3KL45_9BACI|nr:YolD-like family protein [Tepidibacillus fermentans]TCS84457.1 YolD-like protein [Tepidibacillus fermentans]
MNRGNLLWTGSRMMLAEHRQLLNERLKEAGRKEKPLLDEQQKEWIAQSISEAMVNDLEVIITLFEPYREKKIKGKIRKIDHQLRRLKVTVQEDYTWITMDDIMDVSLV